MEATPATHAGVRIRLLRPQRLDVTLSIVLSKAFLLAADDSIKDPTIVRQITLRR